MKLLFSASTYMTIFSSLTSCLTLVMIITNLSGCASSPANPKKAVLTPSIQSLTDLGSLLIDMKNIAKLVKKPQLADGRFSPGEQVFITGKNISQASVQLDSVPLSVLMVTDNGLLIRLPRKMHPFERHQLKLITAYGQATFNFYSSHYVLATDTDGNRIHFLRSNPKKEGEFDNTPLELKQTRSLFNLLSPDGGILFAIGVDSKVDRDDGQTYGLELQTIHLNHPDKPQRIKSQIFTLKSTPISASIDENGQILILGKQHLLIIDASDFSQLVELSQTDLLLNPANLKTTYVDAVFVSNSNKIALLETYSNQVYLYNYIKGQTLQLASQFPLLTNNQRPLSLDLTADPQDPQKLWITMGSNLRLLGRKLNNLISDNVAIEGDTLESIIALDIRDNQMVKSNELKLPKGFIPFFTVFDTAGKLLVSGINNQFFTGHETLSTTEQIKKFVPMLLKSLQIGSILQIDPQTGLTKNLVDGVGIYYHVASLPKKGPVFSLLKLTGSIWFPHIKVAWGIGINGRGTYSLRDLDTSALLPPYSLGQINVQY